MIYLCQKQKKQKKSQNSHQLFSDASMLSFVHLEVLTVRMHALGNVVLFYFIFYLLVFLQTTQQLYHLIYPVFLAVSFSQTLSAYILYSSHLGKL